MSSGWKFEVIHKTLQEDGNLLNVSMLCEIAGVSRSGYYRWVNAEDVREKKEKQDREDFELILKAYHQRGYSKGARGIYMCMVHWNPPVVMNLKKNSERYANMSDERLKKEIARLKNSTGGNTYKRMGQIQAMKDELEKRH